MVAGAGAMLAAIALFLGNSVLAWRDSWPVAGVATRAAVLGMTLLLAGGLALLLLLAAGRRSGAALWLLVFVAGLAVALTAYRAATGQLPAGMVGIVALLDAALALVAMALLLVGRGARAWFQAKDQ